MALGVAATSPISSEIAKGKLLYSLRPILFWIRCLGIDLLQDQRNRHVCCLPYWLWWLVYRLLALSLNLTSQIDVLYFLKNPELYISASSDGEIESATFTWNRIIDYTNHVVHGIGSHLILLIVIRSRWNQLLEALRRCEHMMDPNFYVRLRKITIFGVAYIVLLVKYLKSFIIPLS